jgi:hypothetical protein
MVKVPRGDIAKVHSLPDRAARLHGNPSKARMLNPKKPGNWKVEGRASVTPA